MKGVTPCVAYSTSGALSSTPALSGLPGGLHLSGIDWKTVILPQNYRDQTRRECVLWENLPVRSGGDPKGLLGGGNIGTGPWKIGDGQQLLGGEAYTRLGVIQLLFLFHMRPRKDSPISNAVGPQRLQQKGSWRQ